MAAVGRPQIVYIAVGIERSTFRPLEVPQLIEEGFDQILATAAAITDPFEQAFFVMVHLPYLQPFDDVNKRVSRLAANVPLIKGNFAAVRQSLGEPDPFRLRYREQLRDLIAELVRARVGRKSAAAQIAAWSKKELGPDVRQRFNEIVEAELTGLHEGNFARYRIRPSEFAAWRQGTQCRADISRRL